MPGSHTELEAVVIGLFPRASDARRALNVLREHHFGADEAAAAFREPAGARVDNTPVSASTRESGKWFGQLRQIYHGDDRIESDRIGTGCAGRARAGFVGVCVHAVAAENYVARCADTE